MMWLDFTSYGLSFVAGMLSILAPCVLPLVPIIVGAALNTHRFGPYLLALGLAISFTLIGVFLATLGASLNLDQELFRHAAAFLLIVFGVVLLSTYLQTLFARLTANVGGAGNQALNKLSADSLLGQFLLGLLLGVVWSPCVGPILGATITLASQGEQLSHVFVMMAMFGLGAGLPLIVLGLISRQAMLKIRDKLFTAGRLGKQIMGGVMLCIGILIVSGMDKNVESYLISVSPQWLIHLTTRF